MIAYDVKKAIAHCGIYTQTVKAMRAMNQLNEKLNNFLIKDIDDDEVLDKIADVEISGLVRIWKGTSRGRRSN